MGKPSRPGTLPDFLKGDLGNVYTGIAWVPLERLDTGEGDLILDPRRFFREVNAYSRVEILTYTYSYMPKTLVARLVLGPVHPSYEYLPNREQVRVHPQLHTKLYLCYSSRITCKCAYLGSQNQTAPTTYNIMMRVTSRDLLERLQAYYNHIWNEAKPLRSRQSLFKTGNAPISEISKNSPTASTEMDLFSPQS